MRESHRLSVFHEVGILESDAAFIWYVDAWFYSKYHTFFKHIFAYGAKGWFFVDINTYTMTQSVCEIFIEFVFFENFACYFIEFF